MAFATATITGDKALDRKFKRLAGRVQRDALRKGIRASMTPIAKAARAAIGATDASPSLKRGAKRMIGKRLAKGRKGGAAKGEFGAKVGFAVAKKPRKRLAGTRTRPGVGVSEINIHWFVLGTKKRYTGTRTWSVKKGGVKIGTRSKSTGNVRRYTGFIEAGKFENVMKVALSTSASASIKAAGKKIKQVITKEAKRKG